MSRDTRMLLISAGARGAEQETACRKTEKTARKEQEEPEVHSEAEVQAPRMQEQQASDSSLCCASI